MSLPPVTSESPSKLILEYQPRHLYPLLPLPPSPTIPRNPYPSPSHSSSSTGFLDVNPAKGIPLFSMEKMPFKDWFSGYSEPVCFTTCFLDRERRKRWLSGCSMCDCGCDCCGERDGMVKWRGRGRGGRGRGWREGG